MWAKYTYKSNLNLIVLIILSVFSFTAYSADLKTAKAQGLVGENSSGYLEAVGRIDNAVKALINDINAKRKAKYHKMAKSNGISLSAVEELAGKKTIGKTPAGQYIKPKGGSWKKK